MNWKLIRKIDEFLGVPLIRLVCFVVTLSRHTGGRIIAGPQRILLIKFWGIGNLFMLLPTIKALRASWPEAEIDFLTLESSSEALKMTGAVSEITTIDTSSVVTFILSWKQAVTSLRNKQYDLIIDFEQFARFSALITYQIRADRTIGFETRNQQRHCLYTDSVAYNNNIHITRSFYSLAEKAGVKIPFKPSSDLDDLGQLRKSGRNILTDCGVSEGTIVVVMHIGTSSNFSERRWSPKNYAELADLLIERYNIHVILTGLADESHLVLETWQYLSSTHMASNLGGQLSFSAYFSLIAVSDLVISADTAAVHLASVLNTPVVGLYGPNTPHLYGPWGRGGQALYADFDCSPCITNFNSKLNTCRHAHGRGACMQALSVEKVFYAIEASYFTQSAPCRLAKLVEAVP